MAGGQLYLWGGRGGGAAAARDAYFDDFWALDLSSLRRGRCTATVDTVPQGGMQPEAKSAQGTRKSCHSCSFSLL